MLVDVVRRGWRRRGSARKLDVESAGQLTVVSGVAADFGVALLPDANVVDAQVARELELAPLRFLRGGGASEVGAPREPEVSRNSPGTWSRGRGSC